MAMAAAAASVRQRKKRSAADATGAPSASSPEGEQPQVPLTPGQRANYYFSQHVGLAVAGGGIGLLCCGYGQGWMHDTHLCMLALALCCLGLFFHELRPFNAQALYEEKHKREAGVAE